MTPLTCILVDDEPLARQVLAGLLAETPGVALAGAFASARAAEAFLDTGARVDVVFLDVQMPEQSGLDFARSLLERTLVVFTTAHAGYAAESYDVHALDFLVKPVRAERLARAVERARAYVARAQAADGQVERGPTGVLLVRADRRLYRVALGEIRYVQGMKDYAMLHLPTRRILTAATLGGLAARLPASFLRTSKSYVVNLDHVVAYDPHTVYLDGEDLPLSPLYRDAFTAAFERGAPPGGGP